jgi:hypothetical protein
MSRFFPSKISSYALTKRRLSFLSSSAIGNGALGFSSLVANMRAPDHRSYPLPARDFLSHNDRKRFINHSEQLEKSTMYEADTANELVSLIDTVSLYSSRKRKDHPTAEPVTVDKTQVASAEAIIETRDVANKFE